MLKTDKKHFALTTLSLMTLAILSPIAHANTGSIGNRVWIDANANGIQDQGEAGAANVKITLMQCDSKSEIQATTTNSKGKYSFSKLEAGISYQLAVFPSSTSATTGATTSPFKQGSKRGKDSDLIESAMSSDEPYHSRCFTVKSGQVINSFDMGLVTGSKPPTTPTPTTGTIGDLVFLDADGNGVFSMGEGIQGARVTAYNSAGDIIASMMTDAQGAYKVDVPAACYTMKVELPGSIDTSAVSYESTIESVCVGALETNDTADFMVNSMKPSVKPPLSCTHKVTSHFYHSTDRETGKLLQNYHQTYFVTDITSTDPSYLAGHEHYEAYTTTDSLVATTDASHVLLPTRPSLKYRTNSYNSRTGLRKLVSQGLTHDGTQGWKYNNYIETYPSYEVIGKMKSLGGIKVVYPDGSKSELVNCTILAPSINNHYYTTPVTLDMNGNGQIDITGESTSAMKLNKNITFTATFDFGDGISKETEWLKGDGDALLVDNRDGMAAQDMTGRRLFGDDLGKFTSGYDKLALLDANADGVLTENELTGLALWFDNGDAVVQEGELQSVQTAGVASIDASYKMIEGMMRSSATMKNGKQVMTEDVWFSTSKALSPAATAVEITTDATKKRL